MHKGIMTILILRCSGALQFLVRVGIIIKVTKTYSAGDWLGKSSTRTHLITADLIDRFVAISGDRSRLHCDEAYARARGFSGRVAHGALLIALTSGGIGTELPGDCGILQGMDLSFHSTVHPGDEISIVTTISEFHEELQVLFGTISIR